MNRSGLDDSIGFRLGITYRKLSHLFNQRLKSYELTPEQWAVLVRAAETDGSMQKDIAERAGKDRPTTTRIIDALEAKGFIVKRAGDHDRRSFLVFATEKGKRTVKEVEPLESRTMDEAMEGISPSDRTLLFELLEQINVNADKLSQ
ncbi:MarR family winged helix-turn-helix transcriptional regulator [Cohnella faecalis]|uniref:MarR family transcriptional regulator n=1 Tax=Cohnella faecalis TaxID=2315694 RepID=A0A398CMP5_9BACL|nr:MarR family transcriptional regulator [Cohnella faecalis]RIE04636.1 MarR family transcriptional regulator [Cohnella faecalis]